MSDEEFEKLRVYTTRIDRMLSAYERGLWPRPWVLVLIGMILGAGLFAAGMYVGKGL